MKSSEFVSKFKDWYLWKNLIAMGAVVAAFAPSDFEAQRVRGQVHVVVDDEDARREDLQEGSQRRYRASGSVHVAVGAGEDDAGSGHAARTHSEAHVGGVGARSVGCEGNSPTRCEDVKGEVSDVVSGGGILRAGVT